MILGTFLIYILWEQLFAKMMWKAKLLYVLTGVGSPI